MSEHAPPAEDDTTDDQATESEQEPVTTGAQSVVRALENAGAEYIFGVQGGAIMPVYDALYDSDINHVTMAHEQGASHAADAYGIVTGEPGVCFATSGPGATNLVTGIADANMDSDPMIALTGQVPTEFVGNDAFQETDTVGITQPVTKESYFAADSDTVGDDVSEAFALADAGRQGPTLVDLPKDVTQGETEIEPAAAETPDTYDVQEEADDADVQVAAEALAAADRPVILSGGGVIKADASPALREFAKEYEIPVVTTMPGIGSFPEDHELSLEWAGMHGTGYANMAISNTDCLLAIGTRFDDRLTGGVESFAPDAEVIHIDIDPAEISKNIYADYPLIGDARKVLRQLFDAMPAVPDADEWREQVQTWKDEYPMTYDTPDDEPLKPQYVVEKFSDATPDDTIVCTGVGQHQMWASQFWEYTEPRTWVSSHGLGTMGYGVPAAIGAKLAAPDQEVVCFDGDGSFLMTVQGLSVEGREQIDITYVVLNNEAVGMVRQWQDGFYEGRFPMVPSGGDNGLFALTEDHLEEI